MVGCTVLFPRNVCGQIFWALLGGGLPEFGVRVRALPLPEQTSGRDYLNDSAYQQQIQDWVNQLWQHKDETLAALLEAESAVMADPGRLPELA